jgi:MoaA/NifB/PqqE/SkfB family radical SAM enzyme
MDFDIFSSATEKRKPLTVSLEIIRSCNLKCLHCYLYPEQLKKGLFLPFYKWKKIIDFLNSAGVIFTEVTGGEPFLYPEVFPLLEYLRENDFFITIISNGTLLNREKLLRLKELQVLTLFFSLYGATKETHDKIVGVKGSFVRLLQNIEIAKNLGIKVVLKTSIGKYNYQELEDLIGLSEKWDTKIQIGFLILPNQTGEISDFSFRGEKQSEVLQKIFSYNKSQGVELLLNPETAQGECSALKTSFAVDYAGNMCPCPGINYIVGNILEEPDFEKLWYNQRVEDFIKRNFLAKCRNCTEYMRCNPCPYFILNHKEDYLCEVYQRIKHYAREESKTEYKKK